MGGTPTHSGRLIWVYPVIVAFVYAAIAFAVHAFAPDRFTTPDTASYEGPAECLQRLHRFCTSPEHPSEPMFVRTPGYPVFLAGLYSVAGQSHFAVVLLQGIALAATGWLTCRLGGKVAGIRTGVIAMVILTLDPVSVCASDMVASDTLFTATLAFALLLSLQAARSSRYAAAFGAFLAIATFIRPITQYVLAVVLTIWAVEWFRKPGERRIRLRAAAVLCVAFLAPVCAWSWRNLRVAGAFEFSAIKTCNLLLYRAAGVVADREGISLEQAQSRLRQEIPPAESQGAMYRAYASAATSIILNHPLRYAKQVLAGAAALMLGPGSRALALEYGRPAGRLLRVWSIAYLLAMYGLIGYGIRSRVYRGDQWRVLAAVALYMIAVSAGSEANSRFRVPVVPILSIMAAASVQLLARTLRRNRGRAMVRIPKLHAAGAA